MNHLNLDDLRRRAYGCVLGAAIGDAMGAPHEGRSAADIRREHGPLSGFTSDQSIGTDDTEFTLFNAHILLTYGVGVAPEQVEAEWRDKLLAPGRAYRPGGFSDVISTRNLRRGLHYGASGDFNHQMWSDGVAMAIGPAGVVSAGDPHRAARLASILGHISNGRDGVYTAQAVAAAISVAMTGADPEAMMEAALAAVPVDSWTRRVLARARRVAQTSSDLESALIALDAELVVHYWPWADLATEAVPLAFGVFLAAGGEFRSAVPAGISLGRDADTIGAIVGSLAGAYGGIDAIPAEWVERVQTVPGKCIGFLAGRVIEDAAYELADLALQQSPKATEDGRQILRSDGRWRE